MLFNKQTIKKTIKIMIYRLMYDDINKNPTVIVGRVIVIPIRLLSNRIKLLMNFLVIMLAYTFTMSLILLVPMVISNMLSLKKHRIRILFLGINENHSMQITTLSQITKTTAMISRTFHEDILLVNRDCLKSTKNQFNIIANEIASS